MIDEEIRHGRIDRIVDRGSWVYSGEKIEALTGNEEAAIVIRESDFKRLKRLATATTTVTRHGEVVITQSKYDALIRIAAQHGLTVDFDGVVHES